MWPGRWRELGDDTFDGTDEQRAFVAKALGSPDFAFLEGPPGSGKTTAICELIRLLLERGQRVLLCASTHVAIDNVLERLIKADAPVEAVRIGRADRVDDNVLATQIDRKIERLVEAWKTVPHLSALGAEQLVDMAERTVIDAANLTCGTTMGIVKHPLFRDRDRGRRSEERPITTMPHWDVLIVDEASKTLIQEFLVPALMAKRWVVVGDVRQLAPFTDRGDIVANLRSLVDKEGREVFPSAHQRARLLLFRMTNPELTGTGARWLIVEPPGVLDWLGEEVVGEEDFRPSVVRVVARPNTRGGPFHEVSVDQIRRGDLPALALLACQWVLVADDLLAEVADYLPADLLHHRDLTRGERGLPDSHPLLFRHGWWLERSRPLYRAAGQWRHNEPRTVAEVETHEQQWQTEHDLAAEIAWRLTRVHELRHSRDGRDRERLDRELDALQPVAVDISEYLAEIQEIALPSILEVLQEGIGSARTPRPSALTQGMRKASGDAFRARFASLTYQHRMHADLSVFSREVVYEGRMLRDANTIDLRDRAIGWGFVPFPRRCVWLDICGREQSGKNEDEVRAMRAVVRDFLQWATTAGPPRRTTPTRWEVACLSFYVKQERAISDMLRDVTRDDRRTRFTTGDVELVCATVDRFQGREADLVLLSMRNARRVGFLDSLNRLNVAVTRARQQLVVIGNAHYFGNCRIAELRELVRHSHVVEAGPWLARGRR